MLGARVVDDIIQCNYGSELQVSKLCAKQEQGEGVEETIAIPLGVQIVQGPIWSYMMGFWELREGMPHIFPDPGFIGVVQGVLWGWDGGLCDLREGV